MLRVPVSDTIVCTPEQFGGVCRQILSAYEISAETAVREGIKKVTLETKKIVRVSGPYKDLKGFYRRDLAHKYEGAGDEFTGIVYNKGPHVGLGHLLEHGHRIANQYGFTGGSTKAYRHWLNGQRYVDENAVNIIIRYL